MNRTPASSPGLSASEALFARAREVMPGGVSRNAVLRGPYPLYVAHGEGCYVTDIEGARRIDFCNNMTSQIHGHAHSAILAAVSAQLARGTAFSMTSEAEVLFAEHMCRRAPGFDRIRFVNSGTEGVMAALKAARAYTGRPKIAKVEGAYHGVYDYAEVSQGARPANWGQADSPASVPQAHGTPRAVLDDVVIIPFNDPERAVAILDRHADELACVLIDLLPHRVSLIPASAEFVRVLYDWTRAHGALFVCDEVITFRSSHGGAQAWHAVRPDLTAMGKMIGGGFPVGAVAGRAEVMDVMDPSRNRLLFPLSGTFSANPISMVAGLTTMELFDGEAVLRLNRLAELARSRIAEVIRIADVPACVTGAGSMFRVHMKAEAPRDYRCAFQTDVEARSLKVLLEHMTDNGILMISSGSGALSTPMTEKEIDILGEVMLAGLRKVRAQLPAGRATNDVPEADTQSLQQATAATPSVAVQV